MLMVLVDVFNELSNKPFIFYPYGLAKLIYGMKNLHQARRYRDEPKFLNREMVPLSTWTEPLHISTPPEDLVKNRPRTTRGEPINL